MEVNEIIGLAFDLSSGFASISYTEKGKKPQSLSMSVDDGIYIIPMALYKRKYAQEWYIGDQALFLKDTEKNEDGFQSAESNLVDNILEIYQQKELRYIEGKAYSGEELLGAFIQILYQKACELIGCEKVRNIVVTAQEIEKDFISFIEKTFEPFGYEKKQLHFLNHTEAFVYYTLSRPRELWVNDVTLFEMNEHEFFCDTLQIRKEQNQRKVLVTHKDLSDMASYADIAECDEKVMEQVDLKLSSYLSEDYKKHVVSCVLFTGAGFYGDWYVKTIKEACQRRRVFKGFNLYADGAAALFSVDMAEVSIFCRGRTKLNIGIFIQQNEQEKILVLSKAGISWQEAGNEAEFIVNDTKKMVLKLSTPFSGESQNLEIDLSSFPERENKTMRIRTAISYLNDKTFELTIEDLGFGDFYAPSGIVIRKKITL